MDCETIRRRGIADEYRAGRLPAEDADAYERHYYECERCFQDLRFRDRLAGYLQEEGPRLFAAELAGGRTGPATGVVRERISLWDRLFPGPVWTWGPGLVAVSIFLGVLVGNHQAQRDQLRRLSFVTPHPYIAAELRGEDEEAGFRRAMELYGESRYSEAGTLLESCARSEPGDPDVWFYLGMVELLTNRPRAAVVSLRKAVELAPASGVYRWNLVQALLLTGDRAGVLRELNILAGGNDGYAGKASRLRLRILEGD